MAIDNLDNYQGELLTFIQNLETVLGETPTQQAAITSLTDSTGGTTDGTLAAISGSGADADINNNLAELNEKLEAILAALRAYGLIDS